MKVHMYEESTLSYGPSHIISKYRAEGFEGAACGYVRKLVTKEKSKVTCKMCLHNMKLKSLQL